MSGMYIPKLSLPASCIECDYRDASYGNCCELMPDNPSDSFEEQYRMCPILRLCKDAVFVPDHGRLIDADELESKLWKQRQNYQMLDDTQTADKIMHGLYHAELLLSETSTVVPEG